MISVLLRPRPVEIDLHTAKQYNNKMIMAHDGIYYNILLFDITMRVFIVHLYILCNEIIVAVFFFCCFCYYMVTQCYSFFT